MGYWTNNSEKFRMPDAFVCDVCNELCYTCSISPWVYIEKGEYPSDKKWRCDYCYKHKITYDN